MIGGRPHQRPENAFGSMYLLPCAIIASALIAFGTMAYCLSVGISVVVSHLFYVPIVLAAYRYPDRGIAFAGVLAAGYVAEVLFFIPGDGLEVLNALFRAGFFLIVAAVVSYLSGRLNARESRLRRSEATFRVLLNTADVGILLTDPGKKVVEANTTAIRLFGATGREDLVGRYPDTLFAERDRAAARAYRERVLSGKTPAPGECMLRRLDGTEWPAEVSVTLHAKDGDAPEQLVLSIRDITERKRVEEAMRGEYRYLQVVNGVVAAATASRKFDDLLRVSLAKTVSLLEFDAGAIYLMHPGSETAVLCAREGTGFDLPATVRRDDPFCRDFVAPGEVRCTGEKYPGSGFRLLTVAPLLGDDGPVGWVALGSRRKETISRSDREILLGIGDEIGNAVVKGMLHEDLEEALASANRYLKEANAAVAEVNLYVDILTHDINNANTAAMGYLQMYLEYAAGSDGAMVEKSLAAVHQSNEIIRNVSTLRRLKAGPAELGPVSLGPVIRGLCSYHAGSRITCSGVDATVIADDLIGEVFTNLIGNATKFGGAGVEIIISVREEGDAVMVTVADTGPGIPDAFKPRIFERYQRGETKKIGKGLGLYIVWMLIERYGGSILVGDRVPGRPGEGAAFVLTLPRYHPVMAAGEPND